MKPASPPHRPLELHVWLSPAFPVGSFAYSHGLEWAAGTGIVNNRETAEAWLADLLTCGAPRNDAILLGETWRAVSERRDDRLKELNDLALAMAGSRERHLETVQQGNAFIATIGAAWTNTRFLEIKARLIGDVAYPVAVGCAAAARELPLHDISLVFLTSIIQNLVSALVRLSVIGQTDGQRIIAGLAPAIEETASEVVTSGLNDIGNAAFVSDIAAMAHETQETRLFRS